jgi:DNA-binding transcriptional ArsR family regulator
MDYMKDSAILKAIGHPVRLAILHGLRSSKGCNVNDMVSRLDLPQSTVSQHLSVLRNTGIIEPHKKGVKTCYQISNPKALKLLDVFNG